MDKGGFRMQDSQKIQILADLIEIQTDNDNEKLVADYIEKLFLPYQQQVDIQRITYSPNRDNLVVTMGPKDKPILGLSGHMDVVAIGDLADWKTDPFKATIKDNCLYGRGAADMKSGLAALIVAMLELLESNQVKSLPVQLRLLASVGEETGEYGAAQLTKLGYADNLVGLIIAEPTDNFSKIVYTGKGVIDYKVTSSGKSVHSSTPELGVNAITNLFEFCQQATEKLANLNQINPVLGKLTHSITIFNGGLQVNSIPAKAEMMGNIRTIPEHPNSQVYQILDQIIADLNTKSGFELKIEYIYPEEPIPGSPDSPLVQKVQACYQEMFGHCATLSGSTGANDGSEYLQAKGDFNSINIGPGSETGHQANEYVKLDKYLDAIKLYQKIALSF